LYFFFSITWQLLLANTATLIMAVAVLDFIYTPPIPSTVISNGDDHSDMPVLPVVFDA